MGLRARVGAAGRTTRGAARSTGRFLRRATHAQGAGRTGLGNLIELCAVNSAGDALIAVALAGKLFFGMPIDEARGRVALYLVVTMAPFALVAPLVGPALDHMRSARRIAIAGTMLARGLLCWGMAGAATHNDPLTLLPSAFGALVLSKAFGVSRSAVTPRVLPKQISLVTANARATFAGLIAASVVAPVAAGLTRFIGPGWILRLATFVFFAGAILGLRLPSHIDADETEGAPATAHKGRWRTLLRVGPAVGEAMRANAALRAYSGFLILYLAFVLRTKGFSSVSSNVALGLLAAAAGIGGLTGTGVGAAVKTRAPHMMLYGTLMVTTVITVACAVFFTLWTALVVAFVGGFGQSLGKLSLDAVVQRRIGEEIRSSTFAVSETVHQMVWVIGGVVGLGASMIADGRVALGIVAAALAATLVALLSRRVRHRRTPVEQPARPGGERPAVET
jgi:MFS family permease